MAVPEHAEFTARLARARAAMAAGGADLLLVDHAELLAWLSGYTVSETMYRALLVPARGEPWWVLRELDVEPCRQRSRVAEVVGFPDTADPHAEVARTIRAKGFAAACIGADFHSYGFSAWTRERLQALLPEARFTDLGRISDGLRAVKSPAEIELLGRAAAIADSAMEAVRAAIGPGSTARDAAAVAAATFLRLGADSGETGPIVKGSGEQGFLHGHLADEPLAEGDVLHVELVPKVGGYSARLMRPVLVGRDLHGLAAVAERVVALQDRQIAAMRPGAEARAVDAVLREAMLAQGLREHYDNVTGYTLGLYGRTPRSSDFSGVFLPTSDWSLEAGMTFHMYTTARGLGFSETVVVEPSGGRRLTLSPRRLLQAGR